ncbi:hypothetical protein [Niallia sp. 03190]|uniref:hypothetical protein n=1 Tax=Niallia sp. 03190 TaxID=3458061 RepID=UPI004043BDB7
MNKLLPLLQRYCQTTNITPYVTESGYIELSYIFKEAYKKGLLSRRQLRQFEAIFKEG